MGKDLFFSAKGVCLMAKRFSRFLSASFFTGSSAMF